MAELKENEVVQKPYTLRNVQATDIFSMIKIIRQIGVKNIANALNNENSEEKGWVLIDFIIDRLPYCENEVHEFLSRLSGLQVNEIATLDPDVYMMMIFDVIDQPKFVDFLKVVWGRLQ